MDTKKIGAFLKQCRKEKNLTQEQLAEKFEVSARTVSRWETGINMPDLSILVQLAEYYDVEMRELLDGERSQTMNKEMKETLDKVAVYEGWVKQKALKAGNLAFAGIPLPEGKTEQLSNLWTWAMGMNADSKNKDAAWYFLQYFTSPDFMLYSGTEGACTDTPRTSVMESEEYKAIVGQAEGYLESFETVSANASIFFTPQPYFFECTTMWAETLQDLVISDTYESTEEAMQTLAANLTELVSDLEVE